MIIETLNKRPEEVDDYSIDFNPYLEAKENDTISTFSITVDPDDALIISQENETNGFVSFWISGGEKAREYRVYCSITTIAGRVRTAGIAVKVNQ